MKTITGIAVLLLFCAAQSVYAPMVKANSETSVGPVCRVSVLSLQRASACGSTYVVRNGDTLSAIAARCRVTLADLLRANGLALSSIIRVGQILIVPAGQASTAASAAGCTNPYVVRYGDTLAKIAGHCGISVPDLKRLNGLTSNTIRPGQALLTKGPAPQPVSHPQPGPPAATPAPAAKPAVPSARSATAPTPTPHMEPTIMP